MYWVLVYCFVHHWFDEPVCNEGSYKFNTIEECRASSNGLEKTHCVKKTE